MRFVERVWSGDSAADKVARTLLSPFELAFRSAVALRAALYENGILKIRTNAIPVIGIGNLTVGGTGKTPIAGWVTRRFIDKGRTVAIVLRGYGGDETQVHRIINPGALVIEATDRASGIQIGADSGADVAVLDDAFQHRRAARDVDMVLISADDWTGKQRMLPAGPYREPLDALRRASIVMITRKIASDEKVGEIEQLVTHEAPTAVVAVVSLVPGRLVDYAHPDRTLVPAALSGKSVLAVAGIGNPRAFVRQLEETGARVVSMEFPDHHAYGMSEISDITARSRSFDYIVCTLKDAVKLGPQWPADAGPLWYVSLSVNVERGEAAIDDILLRLDRFRDIR